MHLRSAGLRHPLRHALGRGPAPVSARGVPAGSLRALHRDERASACRAPPVLTGGRGHLARRGIRRRRRGPSPPRPTPRGGTVDPTRRARGHAHGMRCRCRPDQVDRQAGVACRQTGADPRGTAAGPGRRRGPARPRSCRSSTRCPSVPCGAWAPPLPDGSTPWASPPSASWPASPRTPCAGPSAAPTGACCPNWPGARTPGRSRPPVRSSRSDTRRPSPSTSPSTTGCTATSCAWPTPWAPGCARRVWPGGPSR